MGYETLAALAGLLGGIALGLAARLGNFCTLGALEHALFGRDRTRLRMWGVTLGVAVLSVQGLAGLGLIDLPASFHRAIAWNPLASVLGGLTFGYGMALAGNCGFGALVRVGGGDARSLVVVAVMGVAGFATLAGPLAPLRAALFPQSPSEGPQDIASVLASVSGLPAGAVALGIGLALLAWGLTHAPLRAAPAQIAWAAVAGLAVAWGFAATSWLAWASLGGVAVEGPSFTAPVGRTILWLMTSTGADASFSVGSVLGVVIGALAGSLRRGGFRWEACEDPRELGRQVGGAALMGVGGVVAMGCAIGQGLSGFATLAWSGPVTLAAICAGAALGLHRMIAGYQPD
ncbi:YeeE/YedE family protein [Albimonas pacifica]|uniref:Uncharacterized protein n=1 Tax=Albimonas pacifica TaxID=1114924 RepID=A0A1I3H575_9RHOB|nr:YeeE/YedE family protein [Albimonas pacifica]SFI30831.1 hypothetical protein SAMN05216258_105505 [Albimonas pacifica]